MSLSAAKLQSCDISDPAAVSALFREHSIGTVIHLAAVLPSAARADPSLATRVNITGCINLLESAALCSARVVFASSMSVYGAFGSHHVFTERDPTAPIDLYGTAKRYVEICGEILAKRNDLEFVALRIAGVVGAGSGSATSQWRSDIFEKLGTRAKQTITLPFTPGSILSMLHVEDVADMLVRLALAERIPSPLYNSPAENWPMVTLAHLLQSLDPNVSVQTPEVGAKPAPALSDGGLFQRDFGYSLPPLEERLRQATPRLS